MWNEDIAKIRTHLKETKMKENYICQFNVPPTIAKYLKDYKKLRC